MSYFVEKNLKQLCERYNKAAKACGSAKRMFHKEGDAFDARGGWAWTVTQTFKIDGAPSQQTWGFNTKHQAATFVMDAAVFMELSVRRPIDADSGLPPMSQAEREQAAADRSKRADELPYQQWTH